MVQVMLLTCRAIIFSKKGVIEFGILIYLFYLWGMSNDIVLLDLFSGIGGFSLGLTQAGFNITTHYYSEIDRHAIANYKYNFKHSEYVGSVTDLGSGAITRPNIITFGSPCQDFSVAGRRAGMEGQRSSLIGQALRLVAECRPDLFIWENVKGVFSSNNGEDFWAIIQAFTDIGGYRLEWQLLNTAWFLPQNRERIYLIGHLAERSGQLIFPIERGDRKDDGNEKPNEARSVRTLSGGGHSGGNHSSMTLIRHRSDKDYKEGDIAPAVRNSDKAEVRIVAQRGRENGQLLEVQEDDKTNALTGVQKDNLLMIGHIANAVTPDAYLARGKRNRDENGKAVLTSMHERRIRRLTEIECERLQGFPDNWTEYGDYDGVVKKVAKTQRYKMLGNAVTVAVVKEIGMRLIQK